MRDAERGPLKIVFPLESAERRPQVDEPFVREVRVPNRSPAFEHLLRERAGIPVADLRAGVRREGEARVGDLEVLRGATQLDDAIRPLSRGSHIPRCEVEPRAVELRDRLDPERRRR